MGFHEEYECEAPTLERRWWILWQRRWRWWWLFICFWAFI